MPVEELMELLNRALRDGRLSPESAVKVRNTAVSEEAMEAGSSGYSDLEEILIADDEAFLLIESY